MKTSAIIALTAAVAASAKPQAISQDVPVNCAKPNANYCIGGDIILRCDGDAMGTRGRCSDNLSGYPPAGGIAICHESSKLAGDAACQKNCVVHADPSFTLPADQCTPSFTGTSVTQPTDVGTTGIASIPEDTSMIADPTHTETVTGPVDTMTGSTWAPTTTYVLPIQNTTGLTTGTAVHTTVLPTVVTTDDTTPTASETGPATVTGAASANQAGVLLAVAAAVAAYLV